MVILNAFSLNMLPEGMATLTLRVKRLSLEEAKKALAEGFTSAVGHEDTARVLSGLLEMEVPYNRATVTLSPRAPVLVAQYRGPRLPEGATTLPEGAVIEFFLVEVLG